VSVRSAFDDWHASLPLDGEAQVLVAAGRVLADEVDAARVPDEKGATRPAASAVAGLRALMCELKGRAVSDEQTDDWSAPVLAAVRDIA
jgi:hypothetical protein